MKIGVLVIATNKYHVFFNQLYDSFEEHFLPGHEKTYFYLTDSKEDNLPYNVIKLPIEHKPWPLPTLFRYKYFLSAELEILESGVDCLYYTDVDMRAIGKMGDEILPTREKPIVAVAHPGFFKVSKGTPETRSISNAYIHPNEPRDYYVAGGFQGGFTNDYLNAVKHMDKMIDDDYNKGVIPVWHDESIWNRYYTSNLNRYKILSPSYCYPESKYKRKNDNRHYRQLNHIKPLLLALDKNHKEFRKN